MAQVLVQVRKPEQKLQQQLFLANVVFRAAPRQKIHRKIRMIAQCVERLSRDDVPIPA